ncbi:MAG: hypothetical protein J5715_06885 [Clostridiales bacterium]|nr:hypothetical protein [Clostridiales bacterium]
MTDYLLAFFIPAILGALAILVLILTGRKSYADKKAVIASALFQAAGYEIATLLVRVFANLCLWDGNAIPLAALISVSAVTTVAVTLSVLSKDAKITRLLKIAGYSAFIILMAECLIFNLKSFSTGKDHLIAKDIPLSGVTSLEEDGQNKYILADDGIVVFGDTYLVYDKLPGNVRYVSVDQTRQETKSNRAFTLSVEIKDSSMSDSFMTVGAKRAFGYTGRTDFAVRPAESGFALGVHIDPAKNQNFAYDTATIEAGNTTTPIVITSINLWDSAPYEFMFTRVILLWVMVVLIAAIILLKLYDIRYDRSNSYHRIIIELIVFAAVAATFTVQGPDKNIVDYPLTQPVDYYDIYVQTFDAFEKGQLNIDFDPPAGLAELDNPYDFSERNAAGLEDQFLWDRAYFNGKYYSYFGVVPIFINYYPIYWMTGSVPTCDTVIAINGALATLFLALALLAVIRVYCPDAKLLLVVCSIISCSVLSYIPILMNYGYMYNVACITALMFLTMSLWSGFTATVTSGKKKYILYFVSGLALGLTAGSRPIIAVCAALMIPRFIAVLLDKKQKISSRVLQAGTFMLPLLATVAGILYYNYARFGNPMDFGAAYQLTVGDIHNMKMSLSAFPLSIYYFFLIPARQTELFPYFDLSNNIIANAEAYRYTVLNVGLFFFPCILLAYIMFFPAITSKRDRYRALSSSGISMIEHKAVLCLSFILPLLIAWAVYCMAGACFRYSADITIPVVTGCALVLTQCPSDHKKRYILTVMAAVLATAAMWLLIIYYGGVAKMPEGDNFRTNFPNAVEYIEKLIVFWH